jgi:hypothetical protein
MTQGAGIASAANIANSYDPLQDWYGSKFNRPALSKVPQVAGDVHITDLILVPGSMNGLPIKYACAYFDEETLQMTHLFNKAMMLKAGLSGMEKGKVLSLTGVGTARFIEGGQMYMRILHDGV